MDSMFKMDRKRILERRRNLQYFLLDRNYQDVRKQYQGTWIIVTRKNNPPCLLLYQPAGIIGGRQADHFIAIPQNSHRNFRQQAYVTIPLSYLAVFVSSSGADMSSKPILVIDRVSFAVLQKLI